MKKLFALLLCLMPSVSHAEEAITAEEVEQIKTVIIVTLQPCWAPPYNKQTQAVLVDIDVQPDGKMIFSGFTDMQRYTTDNNYKANADMVAKAILDPACNTLKQIPYPEKFGQWRSLSLVFNPINLNDPLVDNAVNWPVDL